MVRPKKVVAPARGKDEDTAIAADDSLMVQSRSRRTIKPNPKYNSKDVIPLKRIDGVDDDDDDDDFDAGHNTEDDEDFRDDGAKDSDIEDTPPVKKRGRPRASEAPRSEPQPQRRLQQIRQDFRETARSTSKILQQSSMTSFLEKKRKLDYSADEGESDEPSTKRRSGPNSTTPVAGRPVGRPPGSANTSGKENASSSLLKKGGDVKMVNIEHIINKGAGTPAKVSPGGPGTRRQQTASPSVVAASTPSPKPTATAGIVRSSIVSAQAKETPGRAPVQVRRTTQVLPGSPAPGKAGIVPQKSPGQVILNRTPVVKPKPATPSPGARILGTRPVTVRGSPNASPVVNRILNNASSSSLVKPYVVPAGAQLEALPDGKTKVTTYENRFIVRVPPAEDEQDAGPALGSGKTPISLIKLRSEIKSLKMPTNLWSYQMKLHTRRGAPDPSTDVPDKPGYMVHSILLNRLVVQTSPKMLNGQTVDTRQYDRTVELLKNQYNVTIDGRPVKLIGAPKIVSDKAEVETLLQIVNQVSIDNLAVKAG